MQDFVAIAVAAACAAWLVRTLVRSVLAPPCRPPHEAAAGDFVPLDDLRNSRPKQSGRP